MPKYKCLLCGRDKFTKKTPHNCNHGFRKRKIIWQEISDINNDNSNDIVLDKLDPLGNVVETIKLSGRWLITTKEGRKYFMNYSYIEEIDPDLGKIQQNFIDNL